MVAAALTKVLRGGRRLIGSSANPLPPPPLQWSGLARRAPEESGVGLPGIIRRASLVARVGPLPPSFGYTGPASPPAHPLLLPPRPGSGIDRRAPEEGGVLRPGIARRTSLVGGIGLLPPRSGGAASPSALTRTPFLQKVRFLSNQQPVGPSPSFTELKKYYVWMEASFQRYDSNYIPLFLSEMDDELGVYIGSCRRNLVFPIMAFALVCWILIGFLQEYYHYNQLKKATIELEKEALEIEKEKEILMAHIIELQKQLALFKIKREVV